MFCEEFHIDKKTFKSWLKGRKTSEVSERAVQAYLVQLASGARAADALPPGQGIRLEDVRELIARLAETIKTVIFIDGDTCLEQVRKLEWMIADRLDLHVIVVINQRAVVPYWWTAPSWCKLIRLEQSLPNEADYTISVIASMWAQIHKVSMYIVARDKFADPLAMILQQVYGINCYVAEPTCSLSLLYLHQEASVRGLSELALAVHELFASNSSEVGGDLQAKLVSMLPHISANLIEKTLSIIREMNRAKVDNTLARVAPGPSKVIPVNVITLSASAPVFTPKIFAPTVTPSYLSGREVSMSPHDHPWLLALREELKTRAVITVAEIGQRYPSEGLASLGSTKWAHVFGLPAVQDMLDIIYLPAGVRTPAAMIQKRTSSNQTVKAEHPSNMSDNELRTAWQQRWKASLADFCDRYNCDKGSFSSWLHERRGFSPASSGAVRTWLTELV